MAEETIARFVTLVGATTGQIRTATEGDKQYTVVPVVALVEGVIHAVNAPAPELVRAPLFQRKLENWKQKPIYSGHPMKDGEPADGLLPDILTTSFGEIRSPAASKALNMEAWLDHSRCLEGAGARVLARAQAIPPRPLDVSVGAWVTIKKEEGTHNGARYAAEWIDWDPNHLAILEDRKGACSSEMGCGTHRYAMRVASDGQSAEIIDEGEHKTLFQRVLSLFRSAMPRGWGDDEVKDELREALMHVEPAFKNGDIVRVKNDAVIYVLYPPPPAYYDGGAYPAPLTYWSRDYTFDTATQKFSVSAERKQVEPTTHYEPYRAAQESPELSEPTPNTPCACGNHAAPAAGDNTMDRKERIAALVANPHSPVKSLKMLEAATDEELTAIEATSETLRAAADAPKPTPAPAPSHPSHPAPSPAPTPTPSPTPKSEAAPAATAEVETEEQMLARMPGTKAIVDAHRAAEAAQKKELVSALRAASQAFPEEELNGKSIDELTKLLSLAKIDAPKVDFSGRAIPRAAADASDLSSYAPPDPYASLNPKAATH